MALTHPGPGPYFIEWRENKDVIPFPIWYPCCDWSQLYDMDSKYFGYGWSVLEKKHSSSYMAVEDIFIYSLN